MKFKLGIRQVAFFLILIGLAIGERLWFDLGPNVELVTLATLLAAYYVNWKAAISVALISLSISDVALGNTSIALFTWSAYFFIAIGAHVSRRWGRSLIKKGIAITFTGVVASIWFYWWTNLGVWLLDSWGMYPKSFGGLVACYINAIPFFKYQLMSNLIIVPIGFFVVESIVMFWRAHTSSSRFLTTNK